MWASAGQCTRGESDSLLATFLQLKKLGTLNFFLNVLSFLKLQVKAKS